jgi:hypothetical protein
MSVKQVRTDLATALANPGSWSVYAFPPASPTANSVVISPADGDYLVPTNNRWDIDFTVNLKITIFVPLFDNQGNLDLLESFMDQVFSKIPQPQFRIGTFAAPYDTSVEAGQMLAADVTVSTLTNWS